MVVVIYDLVHDVKTVFGFSNQLTAYRRSGVKTL